MEGQNFQTYMITPLDLNNVQLRSGSILEKKSPIVVIEESEKENASEKKEPHNEREKLQKQVTPTHFDDIPTPIMEQPLEYISKPHFP